MPLDLEEKLIVFRTLYGACVGVALSLLAIASVLFSSLEMIGVPTNLVGYFTWVYTAILYIPTIPVAKRMGATKRFDKYLRGASTYLAAAYLVHMVIASG